VVVLLASATLATIPTWAEEIPSSTAIPVTFTQTIKAGEAAAGSTVTAKTIQVVHLTDGQVLPKGTTLIGHVVKSQRLVANQDQSSVQSPSVLSIHFDKIAEKGTSIPVSLSVRAMSNAVESYEGSIPEFSNDTDYVGTRVLIGGDRFDPLQKDVVAANGDVVGVNRKDGVFAKLQATESVNRNSSLTCGSTTTEQSVGIFSSSACGLYGFASGDQLRNQSEGNGTFALESHTRTVELHAHSAALLQVVNAAE
jgi:hypothetical protein